MSETMRMPYAARVAALEADLVTERARVVALEAQVAEALEAEQDGSLLGAELAESAIVRERDSLKAERDALRARVAALEAAVRALRHRVYEQVNMCPECDNVEQFVTSLDQILAAPRPTAREEP